MGTIRKRGNSWNAQIRLAGWRGFTKSFKSKRDAHAWVDDLENKLKNQGTPHQKLRKKYLLKDLFERYSLEVAPKHKGVVSEQYRLRSLCRSWLGNLDIRYYRVLHFEQYRQDRSKSVASGTIRRELKLIRQVIDHASKQWGIPIHFNPLAHMKMPEESQPRTRRLTERELAQIFLSADKQRNRLIRPLIEFALETGMRRSELISVTWDDLSESDRILTITMTKNGDQRSIPLSRRARQILLGLDRTTTLIFPLSATCIHQAWRRIKNKNGIENLRFHDLRHEAISRFFERGLSVAEVALMSGHRDVRQLFRYTHMQPRVLINKYNFF
jgi:integrase